MLWKLPPSGDLQRRVIFMSAINLQHLQLVGGWWGAIRAKYTASGSAPSAKCEPCSTLCMRQHILSAGGRLAGPGQAGPGQAGPGQAGPGQAGPGHP